MHYARRILKGGVKHTQFKISVASGGSFAEQVKRKRTRTNADKKAENYQPSKQTYFGVNNGNDEGNKIEIQSGITASVSLEASTSRNQEIIFINRDGAIQSFANFSMAPKNNTVTTAGR